MVPFFLSANNRCESIRAAFDVGSGTTKLKIYKVSLCKEQSISRVRKKGSINCKSSEFMERSVSYAEDVSQSGKISAEKISEGLDALVALKEKAVSCGATEFSGVATSAFRTSENGKSVVAYLSNVTGINLKLVSQEEEALLGFNGAVFKKNIAKNKDVCVWDIGGGSMQIVCRESQKFSFYLGNLASVPFKNAIIQGRKGFFRRIFSRREKTANSYNSPNPVSMNDFLYASRLAKREARKIRKFLGKSLSRSKILGIGGVHVHAVAGSLGKVEYGPIDLKTASFKLLNKTDEMLCEKSKSSTQKKRCLKYVNTAVSNKILVGTLMSHLKIAEVESVDANLTEGLVITESYWKK